MIALASWMGACAFAAAAVAGPALTARRQRRRRLEVGRSLNPPRGLRLPRLGRTWLAAAVVGAGLWLMSQGLWLTGAGWIAALSSLPYLTAQLRRRRQRSELERDLPVMVDLLGQGLTAGSSLEAVMQTLVECFPGPVADELRLYLGRRGLGDSRQEALAFLMKGQDSEDWRFVLGGLIDAEELGAPVSGVLEEQAAALHQRGLARIKAQAARTGPQIALVTVFLSAPSAFLLLAGTALLGSLGQVQVIDWLAP